MAHLVRQQVTYWIDRRSGQRVKAGTPGARKVRAKSAKWYGQGVPGYPPKYRFPLGLEDRKAAQRALDDLVRKAERGQADLPDQGQARKPLAEHLKGFEADLKLGLAARGNRRRRVPAPDQVRIVVQRVRDVIEGCGWKHVPELSARAPAELARYLQGRVGQARKDGGLSHQTAAFILAAVRRFVWWLGRKGAPVRGDLFDDVPGFEPAENRVHDRRAIAPEELARILDAALASKEVVYGLAGGDRYHLYLTAFATGYRAGELAALTPRQFDLGSDPPAVHLAGKKTKAKRHATVPIPPAVAVQLKRYLGPRPADRPVWPAGKWGWPKNAAKVLQHDLAAAGVPYRLDGPHGPAYADFHALRTSFVSALAAAGVGPKELQELARHSDPRITLGVYAKVRPEQLGKAAAMLPLPGQPQPLTRDQVEALAAVGVALWACIHPGLHPTPNPTGPNHAQR